MLRTACIVKLQHTHARFQTSAYSEISALKIPKDEPSLVTRCFSAALMASSAQHSAVAGQVGSAPAHVMEHVLSGFMTMKDTSVFSRLLGTSSGAFSSGVQQRLCGSILAKTSTCPLFLDSVE